MNAGDYMVTQRGAGANMSVDIAASGSASALVQGDAITFQGLYTVGPHSATINEVITAADGTNPRIDQVVLELKDDTHDGSGSNLAQTRVVAGTPTSGATLANRNGAAALPNSACLLADVLVGAGVSSVANAVIRDRRKWARGAFYRTQVTAGDYTKTSNVVALIDSTNIQPRIECSGNPLRINLDIDVEANLATKTLKFDLFVDGVSVSLPLFVPTVAAGATGQRAEIEWVYVPSAGSHLIGPAFSSSDGATSCTVHAVAGQPLIFSIEEIVRQNTANNTTTSG